MKRGTPEHPKTYALAAGLDIPRWGAVGVLESLWHFAQKYAPMGDVGRYTNQEIAFGIGWQGDPDKLVEALGAARWLDKCPCHRWRIHDWPEHADYTTKRGVKRTFLACYGVQVVEPEPDPPADEQLRVDAGETRTPVSDGAHVRADVRECAPAVAVPSRAVPGRATATAVPAGGAPARAAPPGDPPPDSTALAPPYVPVELLRCPDCDVVAVIRQRADIGTGWVCFKRNGGCGTTFDVATSALLAQLPERQVEAVRRSVERLTGGARTVAGGAASVAREAGRLQIAAHIERAEAEPAGKVWDQVLKVLRAKLPSDRYATWIRPTVCHGLLRDDEGVRLVVSVPGREFGEWIARNYWGHIEAALHELRRDELRVYVVCAEAGQGWCLGPDLAEEIARREAAS